MSIPSNNEHMEAFQAETNQHREEALKDLPVENVARMWVIESVSAQLEAAKIPFVLLADSETREGWTNPIRFNRLDYLDDNASFQDRVAITEHKVWNGMGPLMVQYVAGILGCAYVAFMGEPKENGESNPMFGYQISEEPRTAPKFHTFHRPDENE